MFECLRWHNNRPTTRCAPHAHVLRVLSPPDPATMPGTTRPTSLCSFSPVAFDPSSSLPFLLFPIILRNPPLRPGRGGVPDRRSLRNAGLAADGRRLPLARLCAPDSPGTVVGGQCRLSPTVWVRNTIKILCQHLRRTACTYILPQSSDP